ncbi:reverse transcriptase domain-containing protein [Tanacetum coccineum]
MASKGAATEESKDLSTLLLDELISNLKVYEVVLEKDSEVSKNKKEKYKLLAQKPSRCQVTKKLCLQIVKMKNMPWRDSDEDEDLNKDEICLMAHDSNEVKLKPDEWIKDSGCTRHMMGNKSLFSTYEAIDGGKVVFDSNTKSKIIGKGFTQLPNESLAKAWLRMKDLLRSCHGHGLGKGNIIQIFYHGFEDATQEILNAGGIFLYKTPNEAYKLLEDRVLLKLDWSKDAKNKPPKKTISFAEGSDHSKLMEKIKCEMDVQSVEDLIRHRSVMINRREDLKKKKIMLIEDTVKENIEETTMVGVSKIGKTVNQEMTTVIHNLVMKTIQLHQHPKGNSRNAISKKPCENSCCTTYDPPANPNDKVTVIHDDSDDKVEEKHKEENPTPFAPKQTKPIPMKAYKPRIPINVSLVDVLAGMPNYGKFLKELISNKNKLEEISTTFLNEECSAIIQNKIPPKLIDSRSFLISCTLRITIMYNALADLVSCGVAENMLVQVRQFIFLADFVILEMEEDSKVPFILGRPFLYSADAIIRVKGKELNLEVRNERITFMINKAM